jgi:hypothetical protein
MKYWKVQFNGAHEGETGWLPFDENMVALPLLNDSGNPIIEPRDYTPIEFDNTPSWAN